MSIIQRKNCPSQKKAVPLHPENIYDDRAQAHYPKTIFIWDFLPCEGQVV
jgi:hypothetical protein